MYWQASDSATCEKVQCTPNFSQQVEEKINWSLEKIAAMTSTELKAIFAEFHNQHPLNLKNP